MSRFHRLIALSLMGALMSACGAPLPDRTPEPIALPTPSSGTIIKQYNLGAICFTGYDAAKRILLGTTQPRGCFSGNCYKAIESRISASLDDGGKALRFTNFFEIRDLTRIRSTPQVCEAVCVEVGKTPFTVTGVLTGTRYDVFLGERKLGEFELPRAPLAGGLNACVGERW